MDIPKEFLPVLLAQIALFLGLWMVLKRFWFDPVLRVIAAREQRSHGSIADAKRLQDEAARMRREHDAAMDQARVDAQREVQDLLRQADAAQRELIEQATADAQRTAAEMRERVAAEVTAARKDLQTEAHAIARELAQAVLGRAV
jgi:F-type H+-transporting ATPase subunit b